LDLLTLPGEWRRERKSGQTKPYMQPVLNLVCARLANVRNKAQIGSAERLEIPASFAQAQHAVDRSPDLVRVAVILPVILPPTNFAQLMRFGVRKRLESAAQTTRAGRCGSAHLLADAFLRGKFPLFCEE
jgi:hypothetical protein